MYCPNCGKPASGDQKFCRSCGVNVQIHAQMLTGQPSVVEPEKVRLQRGLAEAGMWVGGIITFFFCIVLLMADATQEIRRDIPTVDRIFDYLGIAVAALLIGWGGLLLYFGIRYLWLQAYGASANRQSPQPTALPQGAPTAKLSPEHLREPVPSVTEHTTEFLESAEAHSPVRDPAHQRE